MATKTKRLKVHTGGLTAAGRRHFRTTEETNLRPGVKQVKTPDDAKRKGSFLRRLYGRTTPQAP